MRLRQIFDDAIDQNEIESKYLWYRLSSYPPISVNRLDLSTLTIDLSQTLSDLIYIKHCQPLPNNKVFGLSIDWSVLEFDPQYLFISDDNFKIKALEPPHNEEIYAHNSVITVSCFYNNSIFLYEHDWDSPQVDGSCLHWFGKFDTLQKRWTKLTPLPFTFPTSFVGYNQKILIVGDTLGILVYDIILDSYSKFCMDKFNEDPPKMLIKNDGKIYLISLSQPYWIYSCDGNLLDWTLLFKSEVPLFNDFKYQFGLEMSNYLYYVYYEGSIYFPSEYSLFRFDLKELKLRKIKDLNKN